MRRKQTADDQCRRIEKRNHSLISAKCDQAIRQHPHLPLESEELRQRIRIDVIFAELGRIQRVTNEGAYLSVCIDRVIGQAVREAEDAPEPVNVVE